MTFNELIENDKLNKKLNDCIAKTFNRFSLYRICELDDFKQDVLIHIFKHIDKFDESKSSLNSYIPLLVMTVGKKIIGDAHGRCKTVDKMEVFKNNISLDNQKENDDKSYGDFISLNDYDLEQNVVNELLFDEIFRLPELSEIKKQILYLYKEGYNNKEVSEMLETSRQNVAQHFRNAKRIIVNKIKFD